MTARNETSFRDALKHTQERGIYFFMFVACMIPFSARFSLSWWFQRENGTERERESEREKWRVTKRWNENYSIVSLNLHSRSMCHHLNWSRIVVLKSMPHLELNAMHSFIFTFRKKNSYISISYALGISAYLHTIKIWAVDKSIRYAWRWENCGNSLICKPRPQF